MKMPKLLAAAMLAVSALIFSASVFSAAGQFGVGVTDLSTVAAPYKDGAFAGTLYTNNLSVTGTCTGCGTSISGGTTAGQWARYTGTGWAASTPTLPNTATSGRILRGDGTNWLISQASYPDLVGSGNILFATAANTVGSANAFNFSGTSFLVNAAGPHAVGGALNALSKFAITDNFTGANTLRTEGELTGIANGEIIGLDLQTALNTAASGSHGNVYGARLGNFINTLGGASINTYATVIVDGGASNITGTGAGTSALLELKTINTGATENYGIFLNNISAAAGRYAIRSDGTAESHLGGALTVDGILTATTNAQVDGNLTLSGITALAPGVSASLNMATEVMIHTAPTIGAGLCTAPAIAFSNGSAAFAITVGTSCTGVTTGTINMPSAANGWACSFSNVTSPDANVVAQTGGATNSVTIKNYARTTGLASDFTASESIRAVCMGY